MRAAVRELTQFFQEALRDVWAPVEREITDYFGKEEER